MTPEELCEKLGGYSSANKLRIVYKGKQEYIGTKTSGEWKLNDLGKVLMAEMNAKITVGVAAEAPKKRTRKKVEPEPVVEAPVVTEGEVAPEGEQE